MTAGASAQNDVTTTTTTGSAKSMFVYIGTYTGKGSKGIHVYRLNGESGHLEDTGQVAEASNPSFLALHPSGRYLYAANEVWNPNEKPGAGVSAYGVDAVTGALTFLNHQTTRGGPAHVTIDATGRTVIAANYGGGSVISYRVLEDGRLSEPVSFHQHTGSSVNPDRQKEPHAHSATVDPTNTFVFAADLGLDKLMAYRMDAEKGALVPNEVPYVPVRAGGGPRHFAFHPNGRYGYVINELDSTITAFNYDAAKGSMQEIHSLSTLPADFTGKNSTADIHIAPSASFFTAPIAGTTASPSSRLMRRRGASRQRDTCRRADAHRATSASTRPGTFFSPPIRTRTTSWSFASTRIRAGWHRPDR
jgi:6-phosphogluconolactonase